MKTTLLIKLGIMLGTLTILSSCRGVHWSPDFALPNLSEEAIIHEDGRVIHFQSREMLNYGCLHKDKIIELRELLRDARLKDFSVQAQTEYLRIHRNGSKSYN